MEKETSQSGGWKTVDDYELASRLSFTLWASVPDDELLAAAKSQSLSKGDGLARQAQRMIDDPKALRMLESYVDDWLVLRELGAMSLDTKRYGGFDETLKRQMRDEVMRFTCKLWLQDKDVSELLVGRSSDMSESVAKLYGLNPTGSQAVYELPAGRSGVLSMPAFLAVSSHADVDKPEPSMVFRGLFILRKLLCLDVPPPPKDLMPTPIMVKAGQTQRTAADECAANAACRTCHSQIDSLAYALEPFDALGRTRGKDEFGNTLRSDGVLAAVEVQGDPAYKDAAELFSRLATSRELGTCSVANQLQFSVERTLSDEDSMRSVVPRKFASLCGIHTLASGLPVTAGCGTPWSASRSCEGRSEPPLSTCVDMQIVSMPPSFAMKSSMFAAPSSYTL